MPLTTLSRMLLGLLLFCIGGVLVASEVDELRERAKVMRIKASVLAEQGNKEQAERLARESSELMEAAERMNLKAKGRGEMGVHSTIDKEVHHLKERLQDLHAKEQKMREMKAPEQELAEVRNQITGIERELKQLHAHHAGHGELPAEFRAQAEQLEIAGRRLHHLRVAAQNLKMAEMHDLAHKLMEQAEGMERDVQEARQHLAAEIHKVRERQAEQQPDVLRGMRDEIERLRAEVKELSQKVEKR